MEFPKGVFAIQSHEVVVPCNPTGLHYHASLHTKVIVPFWEEEPPCSYHMLIHGVILQWFTVRVEWVRWPVQFWNKWLVVQLWKCIFRFASQSQDVEREISISNVNRRELGVWWGQKKSGTKIAAWAANLADLMPALSPQSFVAQLPPSSINSAPGHRSVWPSMSLWPSRCISYLWVLFKHVSCFRQLKKDLEFYWNLHFPNYYDIYVCITQRIWVGELWRLGGTNHFHLCCSPPHTTPDPCLGPSIIQFPYGMSYLKGLFEFM